MNTPPHFLVFRDGLLQYPGRAPDGPGDYTIDEKGQLSFTDGVNGGSVVQVLHFVDGKLTKRVTSKTGAAAGTLVPLERTEDF